MDTFEPDCVKCGSGDSYILSVMSEFKDRQDALSTHRASVNRYLGKRSDEEYIKNMCMCDYCEECLLELYHKHDITECPTCNGDLIYIALQIDPEDILNAEGEEEIEEEEDPKLIFFREADLTFDHIVTLPPLA